MKESTGALIWIIVIIAFVICIGLSIRQVRNGLNEPKPKSAKEEYIEQKQLIKENELRQRQMQLDIESARRDSERQIRDAQRMMKSN